MQKSFIGILLLLLLVVVFAVQNTQMVMLNFITWSVEFNLALLILLTVTIGALLTYLFSLPSAFKKNKTIKSLNKQLKKAEAEVEELRNKADDTAVNKKEPEAPNDPMGTPLQ